MPDIIALLKYKQHFGALAIGDGSMQACIDIVSSTPSRNSSPKPRYPCQRSSL